MKHFYSQYIATFDPDTYPVARAFQPGKEKEIKREAIYGCPNCDSFDQTHTTCLPDYNVNIKCNKCRFSAKNVNPNQPYGIFNGSIMSDGNVNVNTPQFQELKKKAKKWRLKRKISEILGNMLS